MIMEIKRKKNKLVPLVLIGCVWIALLFISNGALAQYCNEVFYGAAQNSTNSGTVTFYWGSSLVNTPGNIIQSQSFTDFAGPNTSCSGVSCIESGSSVPQVDYNSFPNSNNDITIGDNQSATLPPGDYDDLTLGSNSTLTISPGVYHFRDDIVMRSGSEIIVSGPGTAVIYVRDQVTLNDSARINTANSDRYVFLFSRDRVRLDSNTSVNGIIYSRDDITLGSGAQVTGAITSDDDIVLNSPSTITYDANAVANTDFDGFCDPAYTTPDLISEWQLDESSWSGVANEVFDNSGNGLHGRARVVDTGPLPTTQSLNPAITGNPGTCGSGDFNGTSDGFVQIDDPGTGSILDVDEFSVTAWVYPRSWATADLATIVSKDTHFEFHLNGSGRINWWWGGGGRELTSSIAVPLNGWHHIAITYRSGEQFIYIDGVERGTNTNTGGVDFNNDPVHIGTDLDFHSRRFNGLIDEVRMYAGPLSVTDVVAVMNDTHPCTLLPSLDYFDIEVGAGTASTCSPFNITITARDSSNNILTDYGGSIDLTTSTNNGDWADVTTQNALIPGAADSGAASYDFDSDAADGDGTDDGSIVLSLANSHAETLTITVEDSGGGVISTSTDVVFSDNAFVVTSVGVDSLDNDVVVGRRHDFTVEMWQRNPANPADAQCSVATEYDVANIKVWMNRAAEDPGTAAPEVTNATNTSTKALTNSAPATPDFTLPFIDGSANFTLLASDVGRYSLSFRDDVSGFSDDTIDGASDVFVARPFGFYLEVVANPGASDANGDIFTVAGEDFAASIWPVAWQTADDQDDNGIADGHDDNDPTNNANLANNAVVSGYGTELPTGAGAQLAAYKVLPVGGADPGLGSSDTPPADGRQIFSFGPGGVQTNTLYFDEVGIIELSAGVLASTMGIDYLGAGTAIASRIQGRSGYVGRFTPARFELSSGTLTPACNSGGFSYMEEPFEVEYTLSALSALGTQTQNYTGAFAKWNPDSSVGVSSYGAIDTVVPTPLSSRISATTLVVWNDGSGEVDALVALQRNTSPDGPFNAVSLGVDMADADAIGFDSGDFDLDVDNDTTDDHVLLGQTSVYFGRLRLSDAFGPETASLPVEFVTEYWSGSNWLASDDDSCTAIDLTEIAYPSGSIAIPANSVVAVGGGITTGTYANISGSAVNFQSGSAGHFFTAPGAGNTGDFQVDVDLTNYPWLRFDWNSDGDFSDSALPPATYTFGSYRGHDRIIYWQEVLN